MTSSQLLQKTNSYSIDLYTKVDVLYQQCRYLEAFELTKDLWDDKTILEKLTTEDIILACRLATRLGAITIANILRRYIWRRDPQHPEVKYYARAYQGKRSLLDDLREYEKEPELQTENVDLASSWIASQASIWSYMRNFEKAHALLDKAIEMNGSSEWLQVCKADILAREDRWSEALEVIRAYETVEMVSPFTVSSLTRIKMKHNHLDEIITNLEFFSKKTQSYNVALNLCWYYCAKAERSQGDEQRHWALKAQAAIDNISKFLPLGEHNLKFAVKS
ncbi:MAG: hypothetical protein HRT88_11110 [Lentisphaeraceae bacterium]|nr:hypothetical protein [Lentisphaeraceae bacterium]